MHMVLTAPAAACRPHICRSTGLMHFKILATSSPDKSGYAGGRHPQPEGTTVTHKHQRLIYDTAAAASTSSTDDSHATRLRLDAGGCCTSPAVWLSPPPTCNAARCPRRSLSPERALHRRRAGPHHRNGGPSAGQPGMGPATLSGGPRTAPSCSVEAAVGIGGWPSRHRRDDRC